jgi:hypothetical protein
MRLILLACVLFFTTPCYTQINYTDLAQQAYPTAKPLTRWWWFAATIDKKSIADNLQWLKRNGFGGVEIAWVYPQNRMDKDTINYTPRQAWLSPQWTEMVTYAKQYADSLNLTCDFTFGSLWPFGDTKVPKRWATQRMRDKKWRQEITASWDYPKKGLVLDHLNKDAFDDYATRTGNALMPAMQGSTSALFCDSWEVETKYLTTKDFLREYKLRYRYKLEPFLDSLYCQADNIHRYRYMKLVSDKVINNFYKPFTQKAHSMFALSRAQCSGAPVDILEAYKNIDIPETEAMLYEPNFANIVASAATLSGKNIVTSETFTCLYGWPRNYIKKEQTADLKLVADALFANGVNQIIWHGKPYTNAGSDNQRFYASVHLGDSGSLAKEVKPFNTYMQNISSVMRKGKNYHDVAMYLPIEDNWMRGELPKEQQFIWAWGHYELRYLYLPQQLKGYRPIWVNATQLSNVKVTDSGIDLGNNNFVKALFVDAEYVDEATHNVFLQLIKKGASIYFKHNYKTIVNYSEEMPVIDVSTLSLKYKNVHATWLGLDSLLPTTVTGATDFDFWIRQEGDTKYIFCAHPKSTNLTFPLQYGQALQDSNANLQRNIIVMHQRQAINIPLIFKPYQSLLFSIDGAGIVKYIDINFIPNTPTFIKRDENEKVKWKVY